MNYLYLIFTLLIVIFLIFKCYIKIKYNFWSRQPVFHYYDLWWWLFPKGIIDSSLPTINKYCNFINIKTNDFTVYDNNTLKEIVNFIKTYYYIQDSATYAPTIKNFSSYFMSTNNKTFISLYYKPTTLLNNDMTFINDKELVGIMTTRAINITLNKCNTFQAYYVDYLCVHSSYRKQNIAPELIQTHHYTQRQKNKKIKVSLFKREGELTGIVALTTYNTYQFYISSIKKSSFPQISGQLIEITKLNIRLLTDLIYKQKENYLCCILPELSNLINLINNNTIIIYGIIEKQELKAAYFFKDSQMIYDVRTDDDKDDETIHKKIKSIDCFGSINCFEEQENFTKCFNIALHKCNKKHNSQLITIENISDNNIIINNLFMLKIIPKIVSPTAYFYYNYAAKSIPPEKTLIIC